MPKKYLELDSNYRNRTLYPNQASFDVPISQSGTNNQLSAVDPITDAYAIQTFRIFDEVISSGTIVANTSAQAIGTGLSFLFTFADINALYKNILQLNYFVGAVLWGTGGNARIVEWKYMYTTGTTYTFFVTTESSLAPGTYNIGQLSNISSTASKQQLFIPASPSIINIFSGFYAFNQTQNKYTTLSNFDNITHIATAQSDISSWTINDIITVRKALPNNYNGVYYVINTALPGGVVIENGYNIFNMNTVYSDFSFINSFVRYYDPVPAPPAPPTPPTVSTLIASISRIIGIVLKISGGNLSAPIYVVDTTGTIYKQYTNNAISFNVEYTPYIATDKLITIGNYVEILQYSRDNFSPFVYNGSITSQNQPISYEIALNSLTLPNVPLATGGRIAFYPCVYVEIENLGSSSSNINTIYSNNPNNYKAIFKLPVTDMNDPRTTPFVKINGNSVVQTIPFKPNCDMRVTVKLGNGTVFTTQQADNPAGQTPNPLLQISFIFEINRI